MRFVATMIITMLAYGCGRTNISHNVEMARKYAPMSSVRTQLWDTQKARQELPDSQEALREWILKTRSADPEWLRLGLEFCDHGLYLTNFKDPNGRVHEYLLLFFVRTESASKLGSLEWVSTEDYDSVNKGWDLLSYTVQQGKTLFGNETVDRLIVRSGQQSAK